MRRIAWQIACLALAAGCRQDASPAARAVPVAEPAAPVAEPAAPSGSAGAPVVASAAPPPTPYTSDIENLCDAVVRSGADQLAARDRPLAIASWLGTHLETAEAHQYLVKIQPLEGAAKAAALEAEARRVGLPGCVLAAEWRPATTSSAAP